MNASAKRGVLVWRVLLWIAKLGALAAIVPLMLIVFGEPGSGPAGAREWIYLLLFPFGFSAGYLYGWRRPIVGGCFSLACIVASLVVIQRTFEAEAYLIWAVLSLPGILFVIAGWKLRGRANPSTATAPRHSRSSDNAPLL